MNTDYLKEFEALNETTQSVFDLGESGLLIILKDGTNLTSWDDVYDYGDVIYISEDLSKCSRSGVFRLRNLKVLVIQNPGKISDDDYLSNRFSQWESLIAFYAINWDVSEVKSMKNMFLDCYSLEYVYLENWDTSSVENFWGMFCGCCSLKTLEGLESWDVTSAVNMESMFESCFSLQDISPLSNWDMSNVENIFEMFRDCYSLRDVGCLDWEFGNLENGDSLFINCSSIKNYPEWYDDEFIGRFGIRKELEGMDDESIYEKIVNGELDYQDIFVAVSYIEDGDLLKDLINNSSGNYYLKRAVLLNPHFTDIEILEENALHSFDEIDRAYAIQNPNFTNVRILKRVIERDGCYIVRFQAERKLEMLKMLTLSMLFCETGLSDSLK